MAAYRRVYDSRHLQADCQEPGSAPEPYARQSTSNRLNTFLFVPRFRLTLTAVCVHKLHLGPIYLPVYLFISSPKRRLVGHIATISHVRFYDFTSPNPRPHNELNAPLACLLYPHKWIITSCCSTDSDRPHRCCQQRITLAHAGCCLYFSMGRVMPPPKKQLPFPLGNPGPMVPWTHPSSHPKRHLDWFSLCSPNGCVRQTDRQTDRFRTKFQRELPSFLKTCEFPFNTA